MQVAKGLTLHQVDHSRKLHGNNKLPEARPVSRLRILASQFLNPLIFILLMAALATFVLADYTDAVAILTVILVNAAFGFSQESRAQGALAALKKMIKPQVEVIRAGESLLLNAEEIVVGDIVKLRLGERVPADGKVLEATSFVINEAVLTGESIPVEKEVNSDELNKLYMGTIVLTGYGSMQVTAVGIQTEFGKIAQTLSAQEEGQTPLQKRLTKFSKQIALVVLGLAIFTFVLGYISPDITGSSHAGAGAVTSSSKLADLITLCISLAVSAIPEGLVIGLAVVLTLSMQRLLKRKALVRKLAVAETLGSVTTICVDKTGTLTEGEMQVARADFSDSNLARKALAAVNNNLNAVDLAVSKWLELTNKKEDSEHLFDVPFNSSVKFAASIYRQQLYVVGAPEVLLEGSTLAASAKADWKAKIQIEAEKGYRLIAVAHREKHGLSSKSDLEKTTDLIEKLEWLGILIIEDPVRKDIKAAFKLITGAGIKIKVITGDQKATAVNVMAQAGIPVHESEILSGVELQTLDDDQLRRQLPSIKLFYRTAPEQKLRIVEILKQQDEVVAMMGDGINDAPALKKADVGVAVANATEVSKETADIVLLDNNMFTIAAAIEEGRTIFENLRKVITYLLSGSMSQVILIIGSLILGLPLALIPLQILFINLVADGLPDMALAFEKPENDLMKQKPISQNTQLLDRRMLTLILIIGVVVNIFIFGIYFFLVQTDTEIERVRSYVFLLLGVDSLIYVYSIRSLRHNIWNQNVFANRVLNLSVLLGLIFIGLSFHIPFVTTALQLRPLSLIEVATVPVLGLLKVVVIEVVKYIFIIRDSRINT